MLKLIVNARNTPIWNCTEYFPDNLRHPISPYAIGIGGIDSEEDYYGKLPKGEYELEKLSDTNGSIWYILKDTSWGAYAETWDTYVSAGDISIVETPNGISFEEFVRVHYNRKIQEKVGTRIVIIEFDDRRVVERSYAFSSGDALGDRTLGYLPVSAIVEGGKILLEDQ